MNAILRLAILLALAGSVRAGEAGKVLLIDDDRLLEGDIERIGERYRIRSGSGEMTIPAKPTMLVLPNKEAAYRHLRGKARLGDPLERVRLSKWCLVNQLLAQAILEAEGALALQPDDRSLRRFVDDLKLRASLAPPPSLPASRPVPMLATSEPATADVNPESFTQFVTKVQPILLNACGQCHCGERGGSFRLARAVTDGDSRATQLNLAAASRFLHREQPSASPLLLRSVSVHGESARPPLTDRQSPAYRHLEEFARLATGRPLTPTVPPAPAAETASAMPIILTESDAAAPIVLPPLKGATRPDKAEAPAKTDDPFDPEQFNRQTPKKKDD